MKAYRAPRSASLLLVPALLLLLCSIGTGCATPEGPDPLERMNRGVFAFNENGDSDYSNTSSATPR